MKTSYLLAPDPRGRTRGVRCNSFRVKHILVNCVWCGVWSWDLSHGCWKPTHNV